MEGIHNTYNYENLDRAEKEFRILELLPSPPLEGQVKCKLSHHSLRNPPKYDALSYTWGDVNSLSLIQLDEDLTFQVPYNTEQALRDLRLRDTSRYLWVDALCINQKNLIERNYQVSLMRYIYQSAQVVRIWLDVTIDPKSPVFLKLGSLNEHSRFQELGDDPSFWEPLRVICSHPYWYRVWIQQELHYATTACLHCFENVVSVESLCWHANLVRMRAITEPVTAAALQWGSYAPGILLQHYGLAVDPIDRAIERHISKDAVFKNILDALDEFREYSSTDARDKLYATQGLIKDYGEGDVEVNYGISVRDTYTNVAKLIMTKYSSLVFLVHVSGDVNISIDLPSWVPNWRDKKPNLLIDVVGRRPRNMESRSYTYKPVVSDDNMKLRVCGFCVDTVVKVFDDVRERTPLGETRNQTASIVVYRALEELRKLRLRSLRHKSASKLRSIFGTFEEGAHRQSWNIVDIRSLIQTLGLHVKTSEYCFSQGQVKRYEGEVKKFLDTYLPDPDQPKQNEERWLETFHSDNADNIWQTLWYSNYELTDTQNYFTSSEGRIGTAPKCVLPNDEVWMIFGCPAPIILRRQGDDYIVLGPAHLAGCMESEPMKGLPRVVKSGQRFKNYLIKEISLR